MQVKDVFGAEPRSTWELLCQPGTGFYIPAYQRQYAWNKSNIDRLFDDASHGLNQLVQKEDAITFIGTLIVIHDTKYETVEPHVKGQLPGHVKLVIDGQQRLTTLLLINTCLYDDIATRASKLENEKEGVFKWLLQQSVSARARLKKTFSEDMSYGDSEYQWYPRMIKAYVDSWSREKLSVRYESPIAYYLHNFTKHTEATNGKPYEHNLPDTEENKLKTHKLIKDNCKAIKKEIKAIAEGGDQEEDLEIPSLEDIVKKPSFQQTLLNAEFPDDIANKLLSPDTDSKTKQFKELIRVILFTNFILERLAVTVVTAKSEDYAFDMFEALNTTGEPLTAFETFRPRVINAETLSNYESSPSHNSMCKIESFFDAYEGAENKQQATSRLLIPFALAETGFKLSKRLSDQRSYLKETFEKLENLESKRALIKNLEYLAIFMKKAWPDNKDEIPDIYGEETENKEITKLCFDVLRQAKHNITIAPLSRFYCIALESTGEARIDTIIEIEEAVKAITAFFTFWRTSRLATDNIDGHYRMLMKEGIPEINIPAFARNPKTKQEDIEGVNSENLKKALRFILKEYGKISSVEDWIKKIRTIPVYKSPKEIVRFLLLTAGHNSVPDVNAPGLLKAGKEGVLKLLTWDQWKREKLTIEHIVPQTQSSGWDPVLYQQNDLTDTLGNLTLLPLIENSSASNRGWADKRLIYSVLAAQSKEDVEVKLNEAEKVGIRFNASTEDILKESRYLPYVAALERVDNWDESLISTRTERLARLAWGKLAPWLGLL